LSDDKIVRFTMAVIAAALALWAAPPSGDPRPQEFGYKVLNVYPHDTGAFTEGLEYRNGYLYESTGLNGRSSVRRVQLETGKVLQEIAVPPQYFGEGITMLNQRIIQLTWQSQTGFIYNQSSFWTESTFSYPGQGWALTNDGKQIYMSDGSYQIRFWDPSTLAETQRITVHDGAKLIQWVNELEYVQGQIYANIWQTNTVAIISPVDGHVTGWINLAGLLTPEEQAQADVLNGIAYDAAGNRLFVTGKLWPKLFQIQLVPVPVERHHSYPDGAALGIR
jgi:glutamine cyclotransferase